MPWPRPERQPHAAIRARIRLHRSIVDAPWFRKSFGDVAHAHAHQGIARVAALRGNFSSDANFLPARTIMQKSTRSCRGFLTTLSESPNTPWGKTVGVAALLRCRKLKLSERDRKTAEYVGAKPFGTFHRRY
jgi:hypothetical protein